MQVYQKVIRLSLVYGSKSWTLIEENKSSINAIDEIIKKRDY